ncbi:MAG: transglycosylase domain-containing protein [Candidatus Peribacteria bacterium]|nr:transglycosylase domain-containing protein [Candidatus Peribacteria bacterium]
MEQASKTYFDKSAIDLNILESSILASIPKGQTYYSPYTRPDRVLGYIIVFPSSDEADKIEVISSKDVESNKESVNLLKDYIANLK